MAAVRVMQCHYEVLGVEMDADENVIRKAYRKAALEWHPDKNMHRIDEATVKFQLISDAYQVLSDPKERSWYDTHRESILRGGDGTFQGGATNFAPNIYKFFNPQAKSNFYEFYSSAFEEISHAERADAERQGKPDPGPMPLFGSKESAFSEVKRFYALWEAFNSKMTFAWMDTYDTREAENRFQRRYVEKLNDTERTNARREYIDGVRSLVDYCKKRDERWALGLVKQEAEDREKRERRERYEAEKKAAKAAQKEALRKELEEELAREEEERQKAAAAAGEAGEEPEEVTAEEEEEDQDHTVWSCSVCSKEFKSDKQLINHEASKKHKDAVKAFLKKGGKLDAAAPSRPSEKPVPSSKEKKQEKVQVTDSVSDLVPCPSCGEQIPNKSEVCPECEMPVYLDDEIEEAQAEEHDEPNEPEVHVKTNGAEKSEDDENESDSDEDLFIPAQRHKNQEPDEEYTDIVEEVEEEVEADDDDEETLESSTGPKGPTPPPAKKLGKAKQKRREREARKATAATQQKDEPIVCAVCGEEFSSRTKLFKHVEDLGHAVPPDEVGNVSSNLSDGKGKRKKKKN